MNRKVIVLVGIVSFGLVGLAAYQAAAAIVRSDREATLSVKRMKQLTSTETGGGTTKAAGDARLSAAAWQSGTSQTD